MSLNGNGVGFQFFSKDSGLNKYVKKITAGFGKFKNTFDDTADAALNKSPKIGEGIGLIEKALEKLDQILTQNKLQTWIASFSLAKLHDIGDGIKNITDGLNLSTGLEDTMVANAKATKALAANYGYTGKAAQKFTSQASSLAYAMNVGTDVAGSAQYAMDTWGKSLKAVGVDSVETAAKVQAVFGIDVNDFGNQLSTLQKEFGFTDKQLSNVVGGMQVFGQQIGDVKSAMAQLPKTVEMVRKKANSLGKTLSADELSEYATQQQEVAAGFYAITHDSKLAQAQADKLTESLIDADVNIGKMFAGTESDLSSFSQGLGIATGDINKSFELMRKGPSGFIKGMAKMVGDMGGISKMTGMQANFIHKQLDEALGPEASNMVWEFFEKSDAATLQSMAAVKDATSSMGKLAKEGFSTGLTLADSFQRAKDAFIMNFRAISRKEAVNFVSETSKEFSVFSKNLSSLAAEGGPMGAIVSKFSEMHQIGALALLPKTLRPMATVFGTMLKEATPLIGALGSMGLNFKHLTLATPVLVLLGLAAAMKAAERRTQEQISTAAKSAASMKMLEGSVSSLTKQRDKLTVGTEAWNKVNQEIVQKQWLVKEAKQLQAAGKDAKKIAAVQAEIAAHEKKRSVEQIAATTKGILEKVKIFVLALPTVLSGAFSALKEMWPVLGPLVLSGLSAVFHWVVDHALPAIGQFITGLWNGVINGNAAEEGTTASKLGASIGNTLHMAFGVAITYVVDYLKSWWSKMGDIWGNDSLSFTDKIKETFTNSFGIIVGIFALAKFTPIFGILKAFMPILSTVGGAFLNLAKNILPMAWSAFKGLAGMALSVGKTLLVEVVPAVLRTVWAIGIELAKAMYSVAVNVIPQLISGLASAVVGMIQFAAQAVRMGITMVLTNPLLAAGAAVVALAGYLAYKVFSDTPKTLEQSADQLKEMGGAAAKAGDDIKALVAKVKAFQEAEAAAAASAIQKTNDAATATARSITGTMATVEMHGHTAFVSVSNAADLARLSTQKASDELAKGLNANVEIIDKQVRIINKMAPPKFDTSNDDAAIKLMKEYDDLAQAQAAAMRNSSGGNMDKSDVETIEKAQDRQAELIAEMQKTYGMNVHDVKALMKMQTEQFTSKKEYMATMGVEEQKSYQASLDMAFESFRVQATQLGKLRAAGQLTNEEYDKQLGVLKNNAQMAKVELEAVTTAVQANWKAALDNSTENAAKMMATAGQVAMKLESETANAMGFVDSRLKESAEGARKALTASFLAQTNAIAQNVALDAAQRKEQLAAVEADYAKQQASLIDKTKAAQALITAQGEGSKDAALKMLDDFASQAKAITAEKVGQTTAAVGSFQATMGVSNEMALQSLEAISKIDPKIFAAKLDKVKATYTSFAQAAIDKSKEMIETTGKALDDLSLKLIDFWQRQRESLTTIGGLSAGDLAALVANITTAISVATVTFFKAFSDVMGTGFSMVFENSFTRVYERTKKFLNDEIALFKTFVKNIGVEFEKAWASASVSMSKAAAGVQRDLTATVGQLRTLTSAIDAHDSQERALRSDARAKAKDIRQMSAQDRDQELLAATNWPAWYDDYSAKFSILLASMTAMANGANGRGGRVTPNSTGANFSVGASTGTTR